MNPTKTAWQRLLGLLLNERGEVPVTLEDESTTADEGLDQETTESTETETTETVPTQATEGDRQQQEDTFFDPKALAPELQSVWKRMQGTYTKKMQSIASTRDAAEIVNRFNTDADFAKQTILQRAAQLGLQINGAPQQQPSSGTSGSGGAPQELVDNIKANLPDELKWMAEAQAKAVWAGMQHTLKPLQEKSAADEKAKRYAEYDSEAARLSEKHPGWEADEDDMNELLGFLQSGQMSDRKHGSRLELLYKLNQVLKGNPGAVAEAQRRQAEAIRSRNPTGQISRQTTDNSSDKIRGAKTNREAWDIARKVAEQEAAKLGLQL